MHSVHSVSVSFALVLAIHGLLRAAAAAVPPVLQPTGRTALGVGSKAVADARLEALKAEMRGQVRDCALVTSHTWAKYLAGRASTCTACFAWCANILPG